MNLTPTERLILRELATCDSPAEIAKRLHRSPHTVEAHCFHLQHKLGLNRRQLLGYAIRQSGSQPTPAAIETDQSEVR